MAGAQNSGLHSAIEFGILLSHKHKIELMIVGRVDKHTQNKLKNQTAFRIKFMNTIPREQIPWMMRSSHLLFSAEVNPPCPNSVIEALSCGLPVIGFDTGSLAEIVQGDAGRLVPYGANQWKLEKPNVQALADVAEDVLQNNEHYRKAAREQAENVFGLDKMVDEYLKVLLG